jgi:hypothetical protein
MDHRRTTTPRPVIEMITTQRRGHASLFRRHVKPETGSPLCTSLAQSNEPLNTTLSSIVMLGSPKKSEAPQYCNAVLCITCGPYQKRSIQRAPRSTSAVSRRYRVAIGQVPSRRLIAAEVIEGLQANSRDSPRVSATSAASADSLKRELAAYRKQVQAFPNTRKTWRSIPRRSSFRSPSSIPASVHRVC